MPTLGASRGPTPTDTICTTNTSKQALLLPSLSRRDARGCQRVVASASARPLTQTALERGGFLCRALLVLEAAHHRGPASSKRDAHLGAIDAACAFDAQTWRPPPADQHARKIVVAIHHNGLGNQLFQWAFGKLVALDAGAAFAARKMREDEGPVRPQRVAPHTIEGWRKKRMCSGRRRSATKRTPPPKCAVDSVECNIGARTTACGKTADSRHWPSHRSKIASSLQDDTCAFIVRLLAALFAVCWVTTAIARRDAGPRRGFGGTARR